MRSVCNSRLCSCVMAEDYYWASEKRFNFGENSWASVFQGLMQLGDVDVASSERV